MTLQNSAFANALGRPDLVFKSRSASTAPPTEIMGGSASAGGYQSDGSPVTGGGRGVLIALLACIGAYASFTWWVRPYLA